MTDPHHEPGRLNFSEPDFVEGLWNEFYQKLRVAVRERVRDIRRPAASESEVALSAFQSFLQRAREGQFPELASQEEVWRLLKTIALRKASDLRKNLRAKKRGGDQAIYNQVDLAGDSASPAGGVDVAVGREPAPSLETELSDLFDSLLQQLPDERHRDVILLRLQGASVARIAEDLGTTTRTVQRLIKKIEMEWRSELLDS